MRLLNYMLYGFGASLLILLLTPVLNQLMQGETPRWKTCLIWYGEKK